MPTYELKGENGTLVVLILASPPGSNTRVVILACNIPGAFPDSGSLRVNDALPFASSMPLNTSMREEVNSVAGLLNIYCP